MATKAGQRIKDNKKKMQVSNLQRLETWFSLLHSDSMKLILFLSVQNTGRERHINTNAAKEGRYLMDLKDSKGVREHAIRLTRMCSFGVSVSKVLNAVNSSSWQSIQKPMPYNLDFTNQKFQVLTMAVCHLMQSTLIPPKTRKEKGLTQGVSHLWIVQGSGGYLFCFG